MMTRDPSEPACPRDKARVSTGDHISGIRHTVILKARDDLFDPTTGGDIVCDDGTVLPGLQVCAHNELTAIPDNVGCCEIVSVGSEVTNVKPGDVVFIDFYDVRQGAIVGDPESLRGIECYIANDHAFRAHFDVKTGQLTPLPGYVVTKRANARMQVAITGTDRVELPRSMLTTGIVSGRTSQGTPAAFVVYEEIVSIGAPEYESDTRPLTVAERRLLTMLTAGEASEYDGLEAVEAEAINAVRAERLEPRATDLHVGDLVAFSTDFGVQVRVRGEFMRIVPMSALLCVIDDRAILDEAIRAGKAGQLRLVG